MRQLNERKAKADDDVRAAETFATNEYGGIRGAAGNTGQAGFGPRYRAATEQLANARTRAQNIVKELNSRTSGRRRQGRSSGR